MSKQKTKDYSEMVGQTFGDVKVLEVLPRRRNGKGSYLPVEYLCECYCGKIFQRIHSNLFKSKSCGCLSNPSLVGRTYGKLKVIEELSERRGSHKVWLCQCVCGNTKKTTTNHLNVGDCISCGCHQASGEYGSITHGKSKERVYTIWRGMKSRCYYENYSEYERYGGRGITVCERWKDSFENFYEDMGDPPTEKYSIDRIDYNGHYCPQNCRWSNPTEQSYNQRTRKDNKSGVPGVRNVGGSKPWQVTLQKDNEMKLRVWVETFEEAVKIRLDAEIEYYGYNREK